MATIEFDSSKRAELVNQLQSYFKSELDQELAQFDGEFLLDFIAETIGSNFYNQGLLDAQAILLSRMDNITEAIDELQQF
jgi:uncharacterized protein (DUF2164 family)